jgi:hypothetical protein
LIAHKTNCKSVKINKLILYFLYLIKKEKKKKKKKKCPLAAPVTHVVDQILNLVQAEPPNGKRHVRRLFFFFLKKRKEKKNKLNSFAFR